MTLTLRKHPKSIFFARNIDIVKDVGGGLNVQCDRGSDVLAEVWIILPYLVVHRSQDIHTLDTTASVLPRLYNDNMNMVIRPTILI